MKKLILDSNDDNVCEYVYCWEDFNSILEESIVYARKLKTDIIYIVNTDENDKYILHTLGLLSTSAATYKELQDKYELRIQPIDEIF